MAPVATGPRQVALSHHHVESGLSVVVEWRHHSEQAGTSRKATNPLSGGHRPKKRRWLISHVVTGARTKRAGNPSRATVRRNGGLQPKDWQALFFHSVGFQESILDFGGYVSEVVCGSCILVGCMSVLGAVFPSFYLASLRFSLRPYQVVSVVTSD